ncbi:MAG: hypothetical protein EBR09_07515 [Proteobacteria bacterium]|jgi:hypothetical protein|nr:hypothetical protein [Pseudomonadota bacterium]
MPLCVPMPWCKAPGPDAAGGEHGACAPEVFWRVVVVSGDDLDLVERKLRHLYRTADGQPCQALLTTEYQQWKRLVLQRFSAGLGAVESTGAAGGTRSRFATPASGDDSRAVRTPRPLVAAIEAFMPGYHLLYVAGAVDISPYRPVTFQAGECAVAGAKRGAEHLEAHKL